MHTHTHLLDGVHGAGCAGRLGYPTVLKNNFAGTQAAEMGEDPPLTHFCRYRGTCDVTSAVRRSVRGGARPFGGPFGAALGGGNIKFAMRVPVSTGGHLHLQFAFM